MPKTAKPVRGSKHRRKKQTPKTVRGRSKRRKSTTTTVSREDIAKIEIFIELVTEILADTERAIGLPVDTELNEPERVERIREELIRISKDDLERDVLKNATTEEFFVELYRFNKKHRQN
jgi:hypothetical protein